MDLTDDRHGELTMQNNTIRTLSLGLLAAGLAGSALAQNAPTLNTVKFGITYYQAHSHTDGITGLGVPAGADAKVGNASTVLATYEREVAPKLGLELVLGVPPTIKAKASGTVPFLGDVLSAKNVAPTAFINYHFGEPGQTLRPYVGVGVNYTKFTSASTPYGWNVSLSDSWGLAGQAGVDYALSRQWGLFASVAAVQVKSDLVAVGAAVLRSTIDFRPIVYTAGASYKF
jgi:outer membrane protein